MAWCISVSVSEQFAQAKPPFVIDCRGNDLEARLQAFRDEGCGMLEKSDDSKYGKFGRAWIWMATRLNVGNRWTANTLHARRDKNDA